MKSVALNQIYKINNAPLPKRAPDIPKPVGSEKKVLNETYEQVSVPGGNLMSMNSNPMSQNINLTTNKIEKIGEESEKVSSDPEKINDKITEQYADEEQDHTS
jgi:hypothetical protein